MITQAAKAVFLTAQATSVICARAGESEDFCIKNRPLTREELRRVINGRGNAYRLPMTFDFWRGAMEIDTGKYPGDIHSVFVNAPAPITGHELDPDFKWVNIDRVQNSGNAALDAQCFFEMEDINEVLAHFPSPLSPCEREIKYLIDIYARKDGRLILTFGNSLTPDTPPESLEAVLKTALEYGEQKVQSFCKTDL